MLLRRLRFALAASLTLAACGLDITGTATNGVTTTGPDSGTPDGTIPAVDVAAPSGDDDDSESGATPPLDAGKDADAQAEIPTGPPPTTVASNVTQLRGIAITPDGMDLYIAQGGANVVHSSLRPSPPAPDTLDNTTDSRAIAWADDLKAVLFIGPNNIGRHNVMTGGANLMSDDHSNVPPGVDIAYAAGKMIGSSTTEVSAYDPTMQAINPLGDFAPATTNGTPAGVVADGDNAYWADTQKNLVGKAALKPVSIGNTLVSNLNAPTSVALDGPTLYIAQADSVVSTTTAAGNSVTTVASKLNKPVSLTFAGGQLYWLEPSGDLKSTMPGPTPGNVQLLETGTPFTDLTRQHLIAVAGKMVFWGNPQDGTVKRITLP